jgi:hypothetical protein
MPLRVPSHVHIRQIRVAMRWRTVCELLLGGFSCEGVSLSRCVLWSSGSTYFLFLPFILWKACCCLWHGLCLLNCVVSWRGELFVCVCSTFLLLLLLLKV